MIEAIICCAILYFGIGSIVFIIYLYKECDLDHVLSYSIFWIIYLIIIIIKSFIIATNCLISDILNMI